jgi:hypothetical protein
MLLLLARQGLAPLVFAQLILLHQEGGRRAGWPCLARTLVAPLAVPVASPAVATAAATLLLVTFARFTLRRARLRVGLALLLRRPRRTLLVVGPAALTALTALATLAALRLSVALLLKAGLLLAVAVLVAAPFASAVAARIPAPTVAAAVILLRPVIAARLVAARLALRRLRRLSGGRGLDLRGRRSRLGLEQAAENAAQESAGGGHGRRL